MLGKRLNGNYLVMDNKPVRSFKKHLYDGRDGIKHMLKIKFVQVFCITVEKNYMPLFSRCEYVVYETPNWLIETVLPKRF